MSAIQKTCTKTHNEWFYLRTPAGAIANISFLHFFTQITTSFVCCHPSKISIRNFQHPLKEPLISLAVGYHPRNSGFPWSLFSQIVLPWGVLTESTKTTRSSQWISFCFQQSDQTMDDMALLLAKIGEQNTIVLQRHTTRLCETSTRQYLLLLTGCQLVQITRNFAGSIRRNGDVTRWR